MPRHRKHSAPRTPGGRPSVAESRTPSPNSVAAGRDVRSNLPELSGRLGGGRKPKILTEQAVLGQRGINLIERIVLAMGCRWVPAPGLDVGIDGYIELADPTTRAALGVLLAVQSRATDGPWSGEDAYSFRYVCDQRELDYWMQGNAPVVLIVSRPSSDEAYWISIKDYFADSTVRASRRITFDKRRDRFTSDILSTLLERGARQDSGLYLAPPPIQESLISNLLTVRSLAHTIFVADTQHSRRSDLFDALKAHNYHGGGEWFPKEGKLFSFLDLREPPWPDLVDRGTVDEFDASEWASSDDPDRIRDFTRLLNAALRERLYPEVRYHDGEGVYAFAPGPGMRERRIISGQGPGRLVFSEYIAKSSHRRVAYRHLAFEGQFHRFDGRWFLSVLPTYWFTSDGRTCSRKNGEYIAALKRLERNEAVLANLRVWEEYLTRPAGLLATEYPYLTFGGLSEVDIDVGIADAAWRTDATADTGSTDNDMDSGPGLWQ